MDNLPITYFSHLYTAFTCPLIPRFHSEKWDVENYYGILKFENTIKGRELHQIFVDWCFDVDIKLYKSDLDSWKDLFLMGKEPDFSEGFFENNFKSWDIIGHAELHIAISYIIRAAHNVTKLYKENVN